MNELVARDLRAAADVLEEDGWMRGQYHGTAPVGLACHCAVGALRVATGYDVPVGYDDSSFWEVEASGPAEDRMTGALATLAKHLYPDLSGVDPEAVVVTWNDQKAGDAAAVVASIRAAADAAEAEL